MQLQRTFAGDMLTSKVTAVRYVRPEDSISTNVNNSLDVVTTVKFQTCCCR